ncbi:hypothetical protein BJX64DRAFT_262543 [Aspergillus heterothallicus]
MTLGAARLCSQSNAKVWPSGEMLLSSLILIAAATSLLWSLHAGVFQAIDIASHDEGFFRARQRDVETRFHADQLKKTSFQDHRAVAQP